MAMRRHEPRKIKGKGRPRRLLGPQTASSPRHIEDVFRRAVELALTSSVVVAAGCASGGDGGSTTSKTTSPMTSQPGDSTPSDSAAGLGGGGRRASGAPAAGSSGSRAGAAGAAGTSASGSSAAGSGGAAAGTLAPAPQTAGTAALDDAGTDPSPLGPSCDADRVWQPLADLAPAEPFDYATLRRAFSGELSTNELSSTGKACATATSTQCQSQLDQLLSDKTFALTQRCGMISECQLFVVTTRGEAARRYASREALLSFLGPIDAPQDALLLVSYDGFLVQCAPVLDSSVIPRELPATEVVEAVDGFQVSVGKLVSDCPYQYARVVLHVSRLGVVTELSRELYPESPLCAGRRPQGWLGPFSRGEPSALARHFAHMAELEAASVIAFESLARELRPAGAPAPLIARLERAAHEERQHAQLTRALAQRFGAQPCLAPTHTCPGEPRSLVAIALDNAVEGCVRETFGAAVGCYQARSAQDPAVAELMRELSRDETSHALLARDLQAWLVTRLSPAERALVAQAHAAAVQALASQLAVPPDASLQALAGLPSVAAARALHATLAHELWAS